MAYKISLVTDSFDVQSNISLHISSEYNIPLVVYGTVEEALSALKQKINTPNILIIDYKISGNKGGDLYAELNVDRKFPIILLTDNFPKDDQSLSGFFVSVPRNKYLKFPIDNDELTISISELLNIKKPSNKIGYRRVSVDEIALLVKNKFVIYLCDHENNYVALDIEKIAAPDEFIADYRKTNQEYLYIKSDEFERFSHLLSSSLENKLKNPRATISEKLSIQLTSIKNIHKTMRELCLTEQEIELAQTCVDTTLKTLNKKPKTADLIAKLMKDQNYQQELALMTSYLSSAVIMNTDWYSLQTMEKLTMSALLMDASLDRSDLAKTTNVTELDLLIPSEKQLVMNHPYKTIELFGDLSELSNDVKNIIISHHERPDGGGYPKGLDSKNISPLSSAFILAHEFSHRLLSYPRTKESLLKTVNEFQNKYSGNNFKKPYQAFISVFKVKR